MFGKIIYFSFEEAGGRGKQEKTFFSLSRCQSTIPPLQNSFKICTLDQSAFIELHQITMKPSRRKVGARAGASKGTPNESVHPTMAAASIAVVRREQ